MSLARIYISHTHEDDDFCHELAGTLRGAGADVWYNERNLDLGQLMPAIEHEIRARPAFIVILSPPALRSGRVYAECTWAATYVRREPARLFLPVLAAAVDQSALWTFLHDFTPLEPQGLRLYPRAETIRRTLYALSLTASVPAPIEAPIAIGNGRDASADELLARGTALQTRGQQAEALTLFQRATELAPDSATAWFHLGHTYNQLGQPAEALEALERAVTLDAGFALAWASKGNALDGLHRYAEALAACDKALILDPNSAFAWNNKGVALIGLERYLEALAAYEAALARDP